MNEKTHIEHSNWKNGFNKLFNDLNQISQEVTFSQLFELIMLSQYWEGYIVTVVNSQAYILYS